MRHHRNTLPIKKRNGRNVASSTGVSHRDMVIQKKKWNLFASIPFTNATSNFAYGLSNVNVSTGTAGISPQTYSSLMNTMALSYEEYRVSRVIVHSQPGLGYTNDRRIISSVFARVDVNSQPTSATLNNLNSVICSESAVNKTYTERSNIKLADFNPICYTTGNNSRPILPTQDQWYDIDERNTHLWRGATVCPVIAEPTISPGELAITCWISVEVHFRTRRPDFASFSAIQAIKDMPIEEESSYEIVTHEDLIDYPTEERDSESVRVES